MKNPIENPCPDFFSDKVKCEDCKHWIDKSDAQEIEMHESPPMYFGNYHNGIRKAYYCPNDKKPYETHQVWPSEKYLKTMEVSKEGIPIGYKKETTTKN